MQVEMLQASFWVLNISCLLHLLIWEEGKDFFSFTFVNFHNSMQVLFFSSGIKIGCCLRSGCSYLPLLQRWSEVQITLGMN